MTSELLAALPDSMKDPLVLVDTDHIIRYMNKAAAENYAKWGGEQLIGKSVLNCHNQNSRQMIIEILEAMHNGEDERLITNNSKHRVYMRAIRSTDGRVIGYFERYEPPVE